MERRVRTCRREFVAREVTGHLDEWDRNHVTGRDVWLAAGKQGIIGLTAPEQYGGAGLDDWRYRNVVYEELYREELYRVNAASLASSFARAGATVVPGARRQAMVEAHAGKIAGYGGSTLALRLDIADEDSQRVFVERAMDKFGRVDGAFNNAGIDQAPAPIDRLELEEWRRVFAAKADDRRRCLAPGLGMQLTLPGPSTASTASSRCFAGWSPTPDGLAGSNPRPPVQPRQRRLNFKVADRDPDQQLTAAQPRVTLPDPPDPAAERAHDIEPVNELGHHDQPRRPRHRRIRGTDPRPTPASRSWSVLKRACPVGVQPPGKNDDAVTSPPVALGIAFHGDFRPGEWKGDGGALAVRLSPDAAPPSGGRDPMSQDGAVHGYHVEVPSYDRGRDFGIADHRRCGSTDRRISRTLRDRYHKGHLGLQRRLCGRLFRRL